MPKFTFFDANDLLSAERLIILIIYIYNAACLCVFPLPTSSIEGVVLGFQHFAWAPK